MFIMSWLLWIRCYLLLALFFLLIYSWGKGVTPRDISSVETKGITSLFSSSSSASFLSSTHQNQHQHHSYNHQRRPLDHDRLECKLIESTTGTVYFIMHGEKHKIDDDNTLKALMFDNSNIYEHNVSNVVLKKYRNGQGLNSNWQMMNDKDFYHWANKVHHCTSIESQESHSSRKKTLLVMVDNREIHPKEKLRNSSYFPLNAVINFQYAKRHNYDFVIFRINSTNIVNEVSRDYHQTKQEIQMELNSSDLESLENYTKNRITLYNPAIKEFR